MNFTGITVQLEDSSYSVNEGEGSVLDICAMIVSGTLERTVNFSLSILDDNGAISWNFDFPTVNFELQFNESNYIVCVDIPITDDNITEGIENFIIAVSSGDPSVNIGSNPSALVTITDNDSKYKSI